MSRKERKKGQYPGLIIKIKIFKLDKIRKRIRTLNLISSANSTFIARKRFRIHGQILNYEKNKRYFRVYLFAHPAKKLKMQEEKGSTANAFEFLSMTYNNYPYASRPSIRGAGIACDSIIKVWSIFTMRKRVTLWRKQERQLNQTN